MNSIFDIVILANVAAQVVLLAFALIRGGRLKTGRFWLPVALALLIAGALGILFADSLIPAPYQALGPLLLLMAALVAFVGMITADLIPAQTRWAMGIGGLWWLMTAVTAVVLGPGTIGQAGWIAAALGSPLSIVTLIGFGVISIYALVTVFYVFYITPLPEISNRALFWVFNLTLYLSGFAMAASGTPLLVVVGGSLLTASMLAATYAQATYRVFDIRNVLVLAVRLILLTVLTAGALFAALLVLDNMAFSDMTERTILAAVLAIAFAVLYTPVRELVNWVIGSLLVGQITDAIDATKRYSQEVSKATEMQQLSDIASRTLNQVLQVRRSGLLIVTNDDSAMTIYAPPPAPTKPGQNTEPATLDIPKSSLLYRQIITERSPISQYDIEFAPEYKSLTPEVRQFFGQLEMSAYAPVVLDDAVIGLLACGAKINDTPLYRRDIQLLVTLANQTGVAIRNTRLVADLKHLNDHMSNLNSSLGDANERMGKLDSVKTDFVTIASHELRTPLAQVRGYTDIIDALNDQGMLDQDQTRGLVNNLRKATERMEELIAAMLDVSQLDVNAMDLRFNQTSPESVLRMAIEPLTDAIKQRRLTLSARGLKGLPPIEADMQRLVQAFRNIIVNAIKFTPDGGRIDIQAQYVENPENGTEPHILVSIHDNGIGINPEHVELIFNKFYRISDPSLHSTGTYKFMGAGPGLGLTIAKGVIDGHGGKIWAESPGYNMETTPGSTFYIQLPLHPPANASRVLPFEEEANEKRTTKTRVERVTVPEPPPMTENKKPLG